MTPLNTKGGLTPFFTLRERGSDPLFGSARFRPGETVGLLGATRFVGRQVMALLRESGCTVVAGSRRPPTDGPGAADGVHWLMLDDTTCRPPLPWEGEHAAIPAPSLWISAAPIWVLPPHLTWMTEAGLQHLVCVSSTSRYTKTASATPAEVAVAEALVRGEEAVRTHVATHGIACTILRPTLVYGRAGDRNITEIARLIRRLGCFPLPGRADGLRQPIHVDDLALACLQAAASPTAAGRDYEVSGAEPLPYRDMVRDVFLAMGRRPCMPRVPMPLLRAALPVLRLVPRYRHWNADMLSRTQNDMSFSHAAAARDFGFKPRPFSLGPDDLPGSP